MDNFYYYSKLIYVNVTQNIHRQVLNTWNLIIETDNFTKVIFCFFLYVKISFVITSTRLFMRQWNERTRYTELVYNTNECAICMDLKKEPVRVNCGHIFCYNCLVMLIKNQKQRISKCPLCRSKIKKFNSVTDFPVESSKIAKLNRMLQHDSIFRQPLTRTQICVGVSLALVAVNIIAFAFDSCTVKN